MSLLLLVTLAIVNKDEHRALCWVRRPAFLLTSFSPVCVYCVVQKLNSKTCHVIYLHFNGQKMRLSGENKGQSLVSSTLARAYQVVINN